MEYNKEKQVYADKKEGEFTIFLDQASKLGYSIWEGETLIESGKVDREGLTLQEYGLVLTQFLTDITEEYPIKAMFYEEVFIKRGDNPGNISGTESLFYIKHKVKDFGFENRIKTLGLDNASWKKYLSDKKTFSTRKNQTDKERIEELVKKRFPQYKALSEDETDAIGMGIAVMVNKGGNYYDVARYNKKLPVYWETSGLNWEGFKEDPELYKRFLRAYEAGGITELSVNKSKQIEDIFYRHLTHEDTLAFMILEPSYRYYYYYMVLYGIEPKDLIKEEDKVYLTNDGKYLNELEEGSYIIYAARKKRL